MGEAITKYDANYTDKTLSLSSVVFKRLQWTFLIGYLLAAAGDSLQGPYRYALCDSYCISRSTIQLLYVISYASSLFIGTFISSLADLYGRRLSCILSGVFYILNCVLLNFSEIWVLAIGSFFWGIANAFFHTGFEAWLIQEHRDCFLDIESLKRILRNSYVGAEIVAIAMGLLAQCLVHFGGFVAPFNIAILFFIVMIIFILRYWPENYGSKQAKPTTSFISALQVLRADPRIVLLGMSSAFFDAALYTFVIEWTPTLQRAQDVDHNHTLPYGIIFAVFMAFEMIGSFVFDPLAKKLRAQSYMIVVFLFAALGLLVPVIVPHSLAAIMAGFIVYQFCVGIIRPSLGLLRSLYIPNEVRSTVMSYIRVPQLILMLIILLIHLSLSTVLICCVVFNILGMLCMIALRGLKLPKEAANMGEAQILLDEPSSPSFQMRQPQLRAASRGSLIPQTSTKFDDIE